MLEAVAAESTTVRRELPERAARVAEVLAEKARLERMELLTREVEAVAAAQGQVLRGQAAQAAPVLLF